MKIAMQEQLVICDNLIKIYKEDDLETVALQGLDLDVYRGEMIAIVGASGSGKSTLLNILGGLDVPSAGRAIVNGYDLTRLKEEERTCYRGQITGYVWQQSGRNLLPDLTIMENIMLPQLLQGVRASRARQRARELLDIVELPMTAQYKPAQLSGGQQQRAAIAVALANQPALLLADEPTGELDSVTAQDIITFFRQLNQTLGITIIIVTHDVAVAAQVDRTIAIRDGRTSTETVRRTQPTAQPAMSGMPRMQPTMQPATQATYDTVYAPDIAGAGASTVIGLSGQTHQEAIFIDRTGLLQLPAAAIEHVPLRGRAELHLAHDHVELWPAGMSELIYPDQHNASGSAVIGSAVIGLPSSSHREVILVDRVGRLQLPHSALSLLPFQGRAYVRIARSHIELWPPDSRGADQQHPY
jgi:ABC-type lipoprotein export system ATPase subunit